MRFMRSMVTGGAGFLGSHLCDYLLAKNHEVICVDSLITGDTKNLVNVWDNENFAFVKRDLYQPFHLEENIDFIFHLASPASPKDYIQNPIHTLKVGGIGTYHMLLLAKEHHARFLFTSSSEVYGDPKVHPQHENYWGHVNPIGVRGVYDEAKRYAEAITMAYHRVHQVDTRICRIFNTFGPRMRLDDGRAVPNFIGQALRGEPITIYGDGSQTRSFCYFSDTIEGLYRLMMSDYALPVNIGNPNELTILEFAKKIKSLTKSSSEIVFLPWVPDDPRQRKPDISTAKKILRWVPKVSLDEGLKKIIIYYQKEYKI